MARAAFFVDELKITDKGKFLLIEGKRKCVHGHVIDEVFITVPAELKGLFRTFETAEDSAKATPSRDKSAAVAGRLKRYFGNN